MRMEEQPMEAAQDTRFEYMKPMFSDASNAATNQTHVPFFNFSQDYMNPMFSVASNATTNQTHVPFFNFSQAMNLYDDDLTAEKDTLLPQEDTLKDFFLGDQPLNLDYSLGQVQTMSAKDANISISPGLVSRTSNSYVGEGSSTGLLQELGGNNGVLNPVLTSENCSNSGFLLPQNNPNFWLSGPNALYHPSGTVSTEVGLGIVNPLDPPPTTALFDNYMFSHATGNSLNIQSQPYSSSQSLPMFAYASASAVAGAGAATGAGAGATADASASSHRHDPMYHQFQMTGFGPHGTPAMGSNIWVPPVATSTKFNPKDFWPPPPSLQNFRDYIPVWEGSLVGRISANRISLNTAKAIIRATSPITLTAEWSSRLEITLFIPQTALNHTLEISHGPIEYVFLHISQFNSLQLYNHLRRKNLCAKIDFPYQILILSPTGSKYHYIGTLFPGDTVFVEPIQGSRSQSNKFKELL